MKTVVLNFSGNVGKSTIARHLLAPRMNSAAVIPVESINSDGTQDETIRGRQFGELQQAMLLVDDAVVDVGASNVEEFLGRMRQYRGSHEEFDFYVVPTVPPSKVQRDTIATIEALAEIGVPAKKIRMVFNMVDLDETPERVFSALFDYHATAKRFTLRPEAVIHENELFERLKGGEHSIQQLLDDDTDYRALIRATADTAERLRFAQQIGLKRLATGVVGELDQVFKVLFK